MPATRPIITRIADYAPDLPDYMSDGSGLVLNVIPRTPTSYGPLSSPAVYSSGLNARCQGAYFGLDAAGDVNGFAGDANNLYQITSSNSTWNIVSKSAGGYSVASDGKWNFTIFGQRIIATDFADNIQSFLIGSSSKFSDLSATAPKARYCAAVKSWLVVANTNDSVSGNDPQRVWWSANGDPTNWPTPGTAQAAQFQSDYQPLYGDGGWIQGIVGNLGNADAAVFMEHAIWRMVYSGGPDIFDFSPAEGVRGTPAPGSIAQNGALVYYLGEDGFYVFDGSTSVPIGANKVDKTFYTNINQNYINRVSSAIDPINKLYIVAYPSNSSALGVPDSLLIYNWFIQKWSSASITSEIVVRALSFGFTLDQLYTKLNYTIDGLPFGLDSRVWTGGNLLLGIFDANHKLNFFTGSSLQATIDSSEIQPVPGQQARIFNARPIVDGGIPTVSISTRNRQIDMPVFNAGSTINSIGTAPQRAVGRYIKSETVIPAASVWTHFSGVELDAAPAGYR
jgi:hypothetical protein